MGGIGYLGNVFAESARSVWSLFWGASLNIFWAVVVFLVGLAAASWVQKLAIKFFELTKLEKFLSKTGIDKLLDKAEIKLGVGDLIAIFLRWLVVLTFFLAAIDILGLNTVSQVLFSILGYVPSIVAAIFVFVLGYLVANLIEGLVKGAVASIDKNIARPLSVLSRWLILLIAFFAALDQLKIAQGLINTFFQGLTYTFVLAVGLSFGLGAKDLVSRILNDWYDKLNKK
ncbi:MAG: hypothetical protein KatS3mg088_257 [Patescibacteria group bacterium]|nr:MAG: hypothetical protein KatS3mg088_257 [Patescibacteria group bacterium]